MLLGGCSGIENNLVPIPASPIGWTDVAPPGTTQPDTGLEPWVNYDVLVVLDTSGSMSDDTLIHFGLAQIPETLDNHASDWQLALITADATTSYMWEVSPTDPDPEWAVMEGINYLLSSGSHLEEGIDAALTFAADNPSWLRPNAVTLLVLVSDEDDQSEVDPNELPSIWPTSLEVVVVVGLKEADRNPEEDPNYKCSADTGSRYLQIAQRQVDICTTGRWSVF
jgi:hypothetical protein